jgi:hypothetical protein
MARFHAAPSGDPTRGFVWRDLDGRERRGQSTQDDLLAFRRLQAVRLAEHLKNCSCHLCGNPRRIWGARTRQELCAEAAAEEDLCEEGLSALSVRSADR